MDIYSRLGRVLLLAQTERLGQHRFVAKFSLSVPLSTRRLHRTPGLNSLQLLSLKPFSAAPAFA